MSASGSLFRRLVNSVANPAKDRRLRGEARVALEVCTSLLSERGEVSGAALARDALVACSELSDGALPHFFNLLVADLSPDPAAVERAYEAYRAAPTQDNLIGLQDAVESPRQELFRRLNMAPGGTTALVRMRQQLLTQLGANPEWKGLDSDLSHLFTAWFNRGFLTLERIDWNTPAIVLEKLIQYEGVHEIKGWDDLRRRLEGDRRCFAFFHPALPYEPLIFIEIALTRGISSSIQPLIGADAPRLDPANADTAIFYSITNCQEGLRGISFGNLLIKQVAQRLGQEFPRIRTFSTLSPIPGFMRWLKRIRDELPTKDAGLAFRQGLALMEDPKWREDASAAARVQKTLMALCAHYLIYGSREPATTDPVARFHLGNGARLERLNWMADTSKAGMERSAGMMVNYLYRLDQVEANHEAYAHEHRVVASVELRKLVKECPLPKA